MPHCVEILFHLDLVKIIYFNNSNYAQLQLGVIIGVHIAFISIGIDIGFQRRT